MSVKSTKMAKKDKIKSTLKRKIDDSESEETLNKKSVKKHKETLDDIEPEELDDEYDDGDNEESENESESDESDYEDMVPELGQNNSSNNNKKKAGSESFSRAITAILGSKIKAHDVADPILIRNKKPAKELEEKKLEAKAKRALAAEKKNSREKDHIKSVIPEDETKLHAYLEHEKVLKKTAQKGVVKLFNAIRAAQKGTQDTLTAHKKGKVVKALDKETANNMSKEQFLDLIRSF